MAKTQIHTVSLPSDIVKMAGNLLYPTKEKANNASKLGQSKSTADHKKMTPIKTPNTRIPNGVIGAIGGKKPKPNIMAMPIRERM